MPRNVTHLTIFMSSPKDVLAERDVLRKTVAQWNKVHSKKYCIIFDVTGSEDATPGIDNEAQTVINKQLMAEFDIFVGIYWHRIGTPTGGAASGSVKEFDIALAKYKDDQNSNSILIYFKTAQIPRYDINPQQIQGVDDLRKRLKNEGVLFGEFEQSSEFSEKLESALSRLADNFDIAETSDKTPKNVVAELPRRVAVTDSDRAEEATRNEKRSLKYDDGGILDYEEMLSESTDQLGVILSELSEELAKIGDGAKDAVSDIESLPANAPTKEKKNIFGKVANRLDKCSVAFEVNREPLRKAYQDIAISIQGLVDTANDFDNVDADELEAWQGDLKGLHSEMIGTSDQISSLSVVLGQIPRMAKQLNLAKRRLSLLLDETASSTLSTASQLSEDIEVLGKMIVQRRK